MTEFCFSLQQCVPFWPVTEAKKLFVKFKESNVCSQHFRISHSHSTVLRMDKGVSKISMPGLKLIRILNVNFKMDVPEEYPTML